MDTHWCQGSLPPTKKTAKMCVPPWLQKKSSRRSTVKSDLELFCMGRWAYSKQGPLGNQTKGATVSQCRSVKLIPSLFLQKVTWFFLRTWKAWVAVALAMMRRNLRCTLEKSYWNPPIRSRNTQSLLAFHPLLQLLNWKSCGVTGVASATVQWGRLVGNEQLLEPWFLCLHLPLGTNTGNLIGETVKPWC